MSEIGNWVLPCLLVVILSHGLVHKVSVFEVFLQGASAGLQTAVGLLPTLVGLITAVTMVKTSGALELLSNLLTPLAGVLGLPEGVIPLLLIHPISGSGGTAVLTDILSTHGADSTVGRIASVMCGSAETTLYSVTVYYGACGITKTRHTLICGLLAHLVTAVVSGIGVRLLF